MPNAVTIPILFSVLPARIIVVFLMVGLIAACGGGDSDDGDGFVDASKIPTATVPANLPDPIIVSGPGPRGPASPTPPAAGQETYQVRAGDTLGAIAVRFNTTLEEIMRTNNITDPARIEVGQALRIPRAGTATPTPIGSPTGTPRPGSVTPTRTPTGGAGSPTATATGTPAPGARTPTATGTAVGGALSYEVKPGDTASGIAAANGITVAELAAANNLTVAELANLQVGQTLRIPRR